MNVISLEVWFKQYNIFVSYGFIHEFIHQQIGSHSWGWTKYSSESKAYSITIDFETLEDHAVTIRDRDTMAQERIALDQVEAWLAPRLLGC